MEDTRPVLLDVQDLKMHFPIRRGLLRRVVGYVYAVDGVNLFIREGETLGLVGESGCGKTTTGRAILRAYEPTAGKVLFRRNGTMVDVLQLDSREMKAIRRDMQIIFQDPFSSLNPRMTVLDIVSEPLQVHEKLSSDELKFRVSELLRRVGLRPEYMNRYPNAFSGGQRQRIGIARALALNPRLIVCDEPVSALDVSIQAQVINLLKELQTEFGLTYLFIAHDLAVVEHISDRIAVMYLGRVVELADSERLYTNPLHPYTEALLSAVPSTDPDREGIRVILTGDVPNPANPPPGCHFHPRCRFAQDICKEKTPEWRELEPDHWVSCHFAEELSLVGVG
ncbi:MAG TPA: oligopeptide/dipeptide ABC transporter ATP-binding protein [Spirillospora sp.]|nr:oligopeptide/dipeptide ABC transporter ATP-binding protein [Spirillospora sp.]